METSINQESIKWRQLGSLIALDVAIIISWIAYNEYQPKLLQQFRFVELAFFLVIVQGIILFITPPIAGLIADKIRKDKGDRLPVISVGINFVSMVFMAVAFTVFADASGSTILRTFFPVMIVFWLVSMNIFHSPAISTVELFVPPDKLPQVSAIFAVIAELSYALEPSIVDIIDFFGAPVTFIVGGVLVFATGYMLQKATKNMSAGGGHETHSDYANIQKSNYGLVFILGLGVGIASMIFFKVLPGIAEANLPFLGENNFKGTFFVSVLAGVAALLSLPISVWVEKTGTVKSVIIGFIAVLFIASSIYFLNFSATFVLVMLCLYPLAFALVSVSALPIAFLSLEAKNKVLGIGLFFSGVELANSLFEIAQQGGWLVF